MSTLVKAGPMRVGALGLTMAVVSALGCGSGDVSSSGEGVSASDTCSVEYRTTGDWGSGFQGDVRVTNRSGRALTPWQLSWDFASGQRITSAWDAQATQSGTRVTVAGPSWNGTLANGGSASFGFVGTLTGGANVVPTSFTLNGIACNGGAVTPPPPPVDSGTPPPPPPVDAGRDTGTPPPPPPPPPPPGGQRIIGYFAAWGVYGRNYHVSSIPANLLTHINYAFANISEGGDCVLGDSYADTDRAYPGDTWDTGVLRGSFHQLQLLKAAHPHLRTLISVGGWTWSTRFSDVAATPASREHFARSCVDFMRRYGFDGIDLDWEYPGGGGLEGNHTRPDDGHNYTLLLTEIRRQMDAVTPSTHYLLTIAAPASVAISARLELPAMSRVLDWVNIMTYDFHGGWETTTGFNAPMRPVAGDPSTDPAVRDTFNVDSAVSAYLSNGLPANQLVMGVPFYGRGWGGVTNANNGLFQRAGALPMGTYEAGVFDYHDLAAHYVTPGTRHWNADAQSPFIWDPARSLFISYDDVESFHAKTAYINRRGMGGAMFWELSGDDAAHTLLSTLRADLP